MLQHLTTTDLQRAMSVIQDTPIPEFNAPQMSTAWEIKIAQYYWFKCSQCNFDWRSWLQPSIVFVSLSFVTEECPNCRRKQVPAYKIGTGGTWRGHQGDCPTNGCTELIAAEMAGDESVDRPFHWSNLDMEAHARVSNNDIDEEDDVGPENKESEKHGPAVIRKPNKTKERAA
jgi:hypothetical protein